MKRDTRRSIRGLKQRALPCIFHLEEERRTRSMTLDLPILSNRSPPIAYSNNIYKPPLTSNSNSPTPSLHSLTLFPDLINSLSRNSRTYLCLRIRWTWTSFWSSLRSAPEELEGSEAEADEDEVEEGEEMETSLQATTRCSSA